MGSSVVEAARSGQTGDCERRPGGHFSSEQPPAHGILGGELEEGVGHWRQKLACRVRGSLGGEPAAPSSLGEVPGERPRWTAPQCRGLIPPGGRRRRSSARSLGPCRAGFSRAAERVSPPTRHPSFATLPLSTRQSRAILSPLPTAQASLCNTVGAGIPAPKLSGFPLCILLRFEAQGNPLWRPSLRPANQAESLPAHRSPSPTIRAASFHASRCSATPSDRGLGGSV